jgi:hypothetical protein
MFSSFYVDPVILGLIFINSVNYALKRIFVDGIFLCVKVVDGMPSYASP